MDAFTIYQRQGLLPEVQPATPVDTVGAFVNTVATALLSSKRFRSLCQTAIRRTSRSLLLERLIVVLGSASKLMRRSGTQLHKAAAWMLEGCRTAIALQVCEVISPEKHSLDILFSGVDRSLVVNQLTQEQRLKEFLIRRNPAVDQDSRVAIQSSQGETTLPYPADYTATEYDEAEFVDVDVLSNHADLEKIFGFGPVFEQLYQELKDAAFPSPLTRIERVLRQHISYDYHQKPIFLVVEWHVLQNLKRESLISNRDIITDTFESIFTLSGDLSCAGAARLSDYLTRTWSEGRDFLNVIETSFSNHLRQDLSEHDPKPVITSGSNADIQLFQISDNAKEQAYIQLSGTFAEIRQRIQQLAWLTATLRHHHEGQLTVSDIDFEAQQVAITNQLGPSSMLTVFRLSLWENDKVMEADSSAAGQCWTSVFPVSVLAYGFPLPQKDRPSNAHGVEVPFEIVAAFSGVRYPLLLYGRVVFVGGPNVLIPGVNVAGDCVQWHFEQSDKWVEQRLAEGDKTWKSRVQTLNLSTLTHSRTFLGYCKTSEVLLGTAEFENVDVFESGVPSASRVAFQLPKEQIIIEVDDKGNGTTSDGSIWKFNRDEAVFINASYTSIEERCWLAARRSALLYEQESSVAFLVSELSVVLQLATFHLRRVSRIRRNKIPLAAISSDGGRASYYAIRKAKDVEVLFEGGIVRKYSRIIDSFLDLVEQRRLQTLINFSHKDRPTVQGLRGWDHAELQAQSYELLERELSVKPPVIKPVWWNLFADESVIVLFTRLSKFPMRNSKKDIDGTFNCRAWDEIPPGEHMLLANITQLEHVRADLCHNPRKYPTRYMLSNKLAWASPSESRLFNHTCRKGGTCNPIQAMIEAGPQENKTQVLPKAKAVEQEQSFLHHPGMIEPDGAVLFANDPSKFERRRCWGQSRPFAKQRLDRNYPFLAAALIVVIMVYWNFYFFLLCLVLAGLAYALQ